MSKTRELIAALTFKGNVPDVTVKARFEYDDLIVEELEWQLPNGSPTEAILLKPKGGNRAITSGFGITRSWRSKIFWKKKDYQDFR